MSNGPIKAAREAFGKRDAVSTPDNARVCKGISRTRGYCGRSSAQRKTAHWDETTCADCRAAGRADGLDVPVEMTWKAGAA